MVLQTRRGCIGERTAELGSWVDYCYQVKNRGVMIYAHANNHYAGHVPAHYRAVGARRGLSELRKPPRMAPKGIIVVRLTDV